MHYKTIVLELLQARPQMHEQLRQSRQLLATVNQLASQLRERHHAWVEEVAPANPGSSPSQITSRALEIALKELEDSLPEEPTSGDDDSLGAVMAFLSRPTPPA